MSNPIAVQFCEWWERARFDDPWFGMGIADSFAWWYAPRGRELSEEEEEAILDELEIRGMVITDLAMPQTSRPALDAVAWPALTSDLEVAA